MAFRTVLRLYIILVNVRLDPELSLHSGSFQTATAVDWLKEVSRVWLAGQLVKVGSSRSTE